MFGSSLVFKCDTVVDGVGSWLCDKRHPASSPNYLRSFTLGGHISTVVAVKTVQWLNRNGTGSAKQDKMSQVVIGNNKRVKYSRLETQQSPDASDFTVVVR